MNALNTYNFFEEMDVCFIDVANQGVKPGDKAVKINGDNWTSNKELNNTYKKLRDIAFQDIINGSSVSDAKQSVINNIHSLVVSKTTKWASVEASMILKFRAHFLEKIKKGAEDDNGFLGQIFKNTLYKSIDLFKHTRDLYEFNERIRIRMNDVFSFFPEEEKVMTVDMFVQYANEQLDKIFV
jgi:hypothetical protein